MKTAPFCWCKRSTRRLTSTRTGGTSRKGLATSTRTTGWATSRSTSWPRTAATRRELRWIQHTKLFSTGPNSYTTFVVGNEASNYQLSLGGYSGEENILPDINGKQFSTKDQNNGLGPNCALSRGGGFWYADIYCGLCFLTGATSNFYCLNLPISVSRIWLLCKTASRVVTGSLRAGVKLGGNAVPRPATSTVRRSHRLKERFFCRKRPFSGRKDNFCYLLLLSHDLLTVMWRILLRLKFSNDLVNLNLIKITALLCGGGALQIWKGVRFFYRGPGIFTVPTTLISHFNHCL